jgi:hypothetical protein
VPAEQSGDPVPVPLGALFLIYAIAPVTPTGGIIIVGGHVHLPRLASLFLVIRMTVHDGLGQIVLSISLRRRYLARPEHRIEWEESHIDS